MIGHAWIMQVDAVPLPWGLYSTCAQSYGCLSVQVDDKTDFSKLKVTQLKQLLKDRGESCPECVEKNDYVKRARALYTSGSSAEL